MEALNRSEEITIQLDDGSKITGKMYYNRSRKGRFKIFYNGSAKNDGRDDYTDFDLMKENARIMLKEMALEVIDHAA